MLGFDASRVVRVDRWVLREERRSAVLALSSVGEAMWLDVMSHCSISALSVLVYCVVVSQRRLCRLGGYRRTSASGKRVEESLAASSFRSFASGKDFETKPLVTSSRLAMFVSALARIEEVKKEVLMRVCRCGRNLENGSKRAARKSTRNERMFFSLTVTAMRSECLQLNVQWSHAVMDDFLKFDIGHRHTLALTCATPLPGPSFN